MGERVEVADVKYGEIRIRARVVRAGHASGRALVSAVPIGFLGGVDPDTGVVIESGHPLEGKSVAGHVLVFPSGKGSTVGSYTLYRLARNGLAPAAIINAQADPVVAVGAIIAEIPMVDQVEISVIHTGDCVLVCEQEIVVRGEMRCDRDSGNHSAECATADQRRAGFGDCSPRWETAARDTG